MKRSLTCLVGLVSLTAAAAFGCYLLSTQFPVADRSTVRLPVPCPPQDRAQAEQVQVLSTHRWSQGVVVLYSALCPSGNKAQLQPIFGHQVVTQAGKSWQVSGSGSYGTEQSATAADRLVDYSVSKSISRGNDRYTILYGQILKPKVTAVEASFDNGQILRDDSGKGVFALISPGSRAVCELRVFGPDNQILQQENLTLPRQFAPTKSSRCLPATRQS
jgi:hypothetical protein